MAARYCIGNPCWICYLKYTPDWNNGRYSHLPNAEPACDCNQTQFSGRHSMWCAVLQWHLKAARQLMSSSKFETSDGILF